MSTELCRNQNKALTSGSLANRGSSVEISWNKPRLSRNVSRPWEVGPGAVCTPSFHRRGVSLNWRTPGPDLPGCTWAAPAVLSPVGWCCRHVLLLPQQAGLQRKNQTALNSGKRICDSSWQLHIIPRLFAIFSVPPSLLPSLSRWISPGQHDRNRERHISRTALFIPLNCSVC